MTREEKNLMMVEAKQTIKKFTARGAAELVNYSSYDEEEAGLLIKLLKTCNDLFEYAEYQSRQIDRIEDLNRSILNEIRKLQQKGGDR